MTECIKCEKKLIGELCKECWDRTHFADECFTAEERLKHKLLTDPRFDNKNKRIIKDILKPAQWRKSHEQSNNNNR